MVLTIAAQEAKRAPRNLDDVLSKLKNVKRAAGGFTSDCPVPGHATPEGHLSLKEVDGKVIVNCHGDLKHTYEAIAQAIGYDTLTFPVSRASKVVATFRYEIEHGQEYYAIDRVEPGKTKPKDFVVKHLENNTYVFNMKDRKPILYHLPEIREWVATGQTIFIPEGERKAERLISLGLAATTSPFGANRGNWKPEFSHELAGANVVVLPDNDAPGKSFAEAKASSLHGVACSVKVVELPGLEQKGDVINWLGLGHTKDELMSIVQGTHEWVAPSGSEYEPESTQNAKQRFDWHAHAIGHNDLLKKELPPVTFLVENLIASPALAILAAPKKRCKSWMALQLSQSVASGAPFLGMETKQGRVVHLALEDGERRLKQRLEMQITRSDLPITYLSEFAALNTNEGFNALKDLISDLQPALVVIDTLAAAKNRKVDENSAGDTADLFNRLHALCTEKNMVILIVAHHGKATTGDVGFDIRGSSAIPGATDVNIGLYKNEDGTFDLRAEGRDIGEVDMRIKFDAEQTWSWQFKGDAKDVRREEAENRILEAIKCFGGEAEVSAIADEAGLARSTVQFEIKRMREAGILGFKPVRVGRITKILYISTPTSSTSSISSINQHHQQCDGVDDVDNGSSSKDESGQSHGVDDVGDNKVSHKTSPIGMPIDEALARWRKHGAPVLHLGQTQNCFDLAQLLENPDVTEEQFKAIKDWLEKNP